MSQGRPFCGREEEVTALVEAYRAVARGDAEGPRVVVLLGEAGLGKTRLVQEFYARIAADAERAGERYWPPALGQVGDNLSVNPPDASWDPTQTMPFLWWGVRLVDPRGHNQVGTGVLAGHVERHLAPHLEAMYRAQRNRRRLRQLARMGGAVVADAVTDMVPVLGLLKKVSEAGLELKGLHDAWRADRAPIDATALDSARRTSLIEQVLRDLGALFGAAGGPSVPMVLLIDDAQLSRFDPSVTAFVEALLPAMSAGRWPLLLLVTHWEREWEEDAEDGAPSVARALRAHAADRAGPMAVLPLRPLPDLEPVVAAALPGLPPEQRRALLQRAGGNPRYLDELLLQTASPLARAWFVGRDPGAALTERGLEDLLRRGTSLTELAVHRFGDAPEAVQRTLALASLLGVEFLAPLLSRATPPGGAATLEETQASLEQAERVHGYLVRASQAVTAFRQPLYHDVARQFLPAYYDEEEAAAALASALRAGLHERAVLGDLTPEEVRVLARSAVLAFEQASDEADRRLAAHGLFLLLVDAREQGDVARALDLARRLASVVAAIGDEHLDGDLAWLRAADAAFALAGEADARRPLLQRLLRLTGEAYDDDANPWSARMYLRTLLDVSEFHVAQGATELADEAMGLALQVVTAIDAEDDDVATWTTVGAWFRRLAQWLLARGAFADAAAMARQAVMLARHVLALEPTADAHLDLAAALRTTLRAFPLAGVELDAVAAAQEAVEQAREATRLGATADARLDLAAALDALAAAQVGAGEVASAGAAMQESLAIARALHEASGVARAHLRDVADSLERLARLGLVTDAHDAAWEHAEEAVAARREARAGSDAPEDAALLGQALTLAARVAAARSERQQAKALAREAAELLERTWRPGDAFATGRWLDAWQAVTELEALDDERAAVRARLAAYDARIVEAPRSVLEHLSAALAAMEEIRAELLAVDDDLPGAAQARERARAFAAGEFPEGALVPPAELPGARPD